MGGRADGSGAVDDPSAAAMVILGLHRRVEHLTWVDNLTRLGKQTQIDKLT